MKVFHEVKQTSIKKLIIPLEHVKFGKLATVTEQLQCCVYTAVCTMLCVQCALLTMQLNLLHVLYLLNSSIWAPPVSLTNQLPAKYK